MSLRAGSWIQNLKHLLAPLGATAFSTVAAISGQSDPTTASMLTAAGAATLMTASSALTGLIGNRLTSRLHERLTDPRELLRNHDLHRLCGEAVARLIESEAAAAEDRGATDHQTILKALAAGVREDWDALTSLQGWQEQFDHLSREGIVEMMREAGVNWSRQTSLDVNAWETALRPLAAKHAQALTDPDVRCLAEILHTSHSQTVRELLKSDFQSGGDGSPSGRAFPGLLLILHAETLKSLTELVAGQQQLSDEIRQAFGDGKLVITDAVKSIRLSAEELLADHELALAAFSELLDDWDQTKRDWLKAAQSLQRSIESVERQQQAHIELDREGHAQTQAAVADLKGSVDEIAARPSSQSAVVSKVEVTVNNSPAAIAPADSTVPAKSSGERQAHGGSISVLSSLLGQVTFHDSGPFVARTKELNRLKKLIPSEDESQGDSPRVTVLTGPTGVGKTRLLERFVVKFWKPHFEDPEIVRLVMDQTLREADEIHQACLVQLASALRLEGPQAEIAERLALWLDNPGTLLVIENVDSGECAKAVTQLVKSLSGRGSAVQIILTSWIDRLGTSQQWEVIPVEHFTAQNCLKLLKDELGRRRVDDLLGQNLEQLVERLDRLPLALHLAAGHLERGDSPDEYWRRLQEVTLDLAPADDADSSPTLHRQFLLAMQVLEQDLARDAGSDASRLAAGFSQLGHAPLTGFGQSIGTTVSGLSASDYGRVTRVAERLHLLERVEPDASAITAETRLRLRSLFGFWLRTRTSDDSGLQRLTDWFVVRLPKPMRDDTRDQPWVDINAESAALLDWLDRVPAGRVADVLRVCDDFASAIGPFPAWTGFCDRAIPDCKTDDTGSDLLRVLSWVCAAGGDMARALETASEKLTLEQSRGNQQEIGEAAITVGDIHAAQGRLDEALSIWQQTALPAFGSGGHSLAVANIQSRVADVLQSRGELDEALRIRREEELPVYERLGDIRAKAVAQASIAGVLQDQGEYDEALRIHREESLTAFEQLGDVRARAVAQGSIADVLQARGDWDEALRIRRDDQLPVFERVGDVRSRAVAQGRIADVLQAQGDLDEALRIRREEELPVYVRLGDVREMAVAQGKIADVLQAQGDLDEALRIRREEELPVYVRLGEVNAMFLTQMKIADIDAEHGDVKAALAAYREIHPRVEQLGDAQTLVWFYEGMAALYSQRDEGADRRRCRELLQQALELAEKMKLPRSVELKKILRQMRR